MAKYIVVIKGGPIGDFTCIATDSNMETAKENALWSYNSARAHDGIKPLDALPKGTKMIRIYQD